MRWSFFKRKVPAAHSERDYDNDIISSRDDVLTSIYSDPRMDPIKFQRKPTKRTPLALAMIKRNSLMKSFARQQSVSTHTDEEDDREPDKANFNVHNKRVLYCKESLSLFTENHRIRKACVWFTEWKYTEYIVVTVIIINSVLLGLVDYRDGAESSINSLMKVLNPIFISLYAVEVLMKIIAMGLCQEEGTYLRNLQNLIDVFVVISGFFIGYKPLEYFSILRLPRVFLIFKDFNFFRAAVLMFSTISKSMWQFLVVIVLMVYVFGLFAILGLNTYTNVLSQRCRTTSAPIGDVWPIDNSIMRVCGGFFQCPEGTYCGSAYEFQDQLTGSIDQELFYPEFEWGLMNFDNILNSMANIFVLMSSVGWSNIFDMVADATDKITALLFFVMTMLIILAFTINLVVAIIVDQISRHKPKDFSKSMSRTFSVKSLTSTMVVPGSSSGFISFREIVHYIQKRYKHSKTVSLKKSCFNSPLTIDSGFRLL